MSYERILVAVDGTPTSDKALAAAIQLASEKGSTVRLVHVIDELGLALGLEYPGDVIRMAREQGEKILNAGLAAIEKAGVKGQSHLMDMSGKRLGEAVAEEALAWRADLVVVGTHGRRGVSRMLLGSGAESVIRLVAVPVLVIRSNTSAKGL